MRRGLQKITEYNILTELFVRAVLLAAVYIMQLTLHPHIRYITEAEHLNDYRRPRRDSYVPVWLLICLIIVVPLLSITLTLLITRNYVDTTQTLLAWTLALSINAFLTETFKLTVGRPRPDFFYRCFPNGKATAGFKCTGQLRDVMEGRKSFPSGHSSFSFCSLGFASMMLCGKLGMLSKNRGQGVCVIACLLPLMLAGLVAVSRYCDYHHHWEDVFAGSLLGFASSHFCYLQYFHPLDSELSGYVYVDELIVVNSQTPCCTKDLNNEGMKAAKRLSNKNTRKQ